MNDPWRDLAQWARQARPPTATVVVAFTAAWFATATGVALFVGAPYLLAFSASPARLEAGGTLAALLVAIEILAFLRAPARYVERVSGHGLARTAVVTWRRWLLLTVGTWPYRRWRSASTGDLMERALDDTDLLQDLWLRVVLPAAAVVLTMLGSDLAVLALTGPQLDGVAGALTLLACQVVGIGVLVGGLRPLIVDERAVRASRSQLVAEQVAWLGIAAEVDLLDGGRFRLGRLADADRAITRAEGRRIQRHLRLSAFTATWPIVTIALVGSTAARGVHLAGRSDLIVLLLAFSSAELLIVMRRAVLAATSVTAATARLDGLIERAVLGDRPFPSTGDLTFNNVHWRENGRDVLNGVTFTVPRGQKVALVGPVGVGKSTLLRLAARLDTVDAGSIQVGDTPLCEIDEADLRTHVAYVSSDPGLLEGVAARILRVGRTAQQDPGALLSRLGIDVDREGRLAHLSRGQSSRVALARAVITDPAVLLLDEPTSGLGASERSLVLSLLSSSTATIVIATHDAEVIAFCDSFYDAASLNSHSLG